MSTHDCPHCRHHPVDGKLAVEVNDLWLSYGDTTILRGVSLHIPAGQLVALIGPNGSGKTTLLRCLLGLQKADRGTTRLFGTDDLSRALPRIGYVPQRLAIDRSFMLSVREFLCLRIPETRHWFWSSRSKIDGILKSRLAEIGVAPLLDRPLAGLSGGQLQRVLIAFSLLGHPDLLLLDEPTAGVDTPGEHTFYELIAQVHRDRKLTVVLVSHDLSMVYKHASWVYALNGVICCEGTPEHVMNAESLKHAYGIHVSPYHHHHHEGHPHGHTH
jgi:ABC-type Mn2+/Zn2+ transport system ATPase subunit